MIYYAIGIAGLIMALHIATEEGGLLGFYGKWLSRNAGKRWANPLGGCLVCFAFWVSVIACIILVCFDQIKIIESLLIVGIVHIILRIVNRINL